MKVHGIELQVGLEPPELYKSHILAFNEVFLRMFQEFEKHDSLTFKFRAWQEYREGSIQYDLGYLMCSKVWKTLEYNQLVQTRKLRESYEEDGQQKKRTLTIVEPTSLGIFAYENGQLLSIKQRWSESEILIGIGKPYTTFMALWHRVKSMAKIGGVARTRIEKWHYEFKDYVFNNMLDKPKEQVEDMAIIFAREHIASAPTKFGRRNKIKHANNEIMMKIGETVVVKKPNHSLLDYQ
jgi:hypothetical protein